MWKVFCPTFLLFCLCIQENRSSQIDSQCLQCICQVETQCQNVGCITIPGNIVACGYYLIEEPYYIDCGQPGKQANQTTEQAWQSCSQDFNCASQCVTAYTQRYGTYCSGQANPSCEVYARVHDGGPMGCQQDYTLNFWYQVQACYLPGTTLLQTTVNAPK